MLRFFAIRDSLDDGTFRAPFPSFTFEDLGLSMEFTPQIHSATEVSLEIQMQIRLLSGDSANGLPIISNRELQTSVRLKEGEAAVLTGMAIYEERRNSSGISWLSEIPFVGRLFRDSSRQFNRSELLLTIRPRVVRLPASEIEPPLALRYGPEQRPLSGF